MLGRQLEVKHMQPSSIHTSIKQVLFISVGEIFTIENKHFKIQRMNHENNNDVGKSKRSMSLQCLKQFSWEGLPLHKEVEWEPLLTCMCLSLLLAGSFWLSCSYWWLGLQRKPGRNSCLLWLGERRMMMKGTKLENINCLNFSWIF